jgi:hypothetical protein
MTGSLKGLLEGAVFGAITGGFAGYLKDAALASKAAVISKATSAGQAVSQTAIKAIEFATKVKSVVGQALIGGLRAAHNGGKFLTGFLTGGVGKLVTFGTNLLAGDSFGEKLVQGLVVATADGAIAALAGRSFELGFITAGLAFAVNEVATEVHKTSVRSKYDKLVTRVRNEVRDPNAIVNFTNGDMTVIAQQKYYHALANAEGGVPFSEFADMAGADISFLSGPANSTRLFSVSGFTGVFSVRNGTFLGGVLNYVGIGAANNAYGVPWALGGIATGVLTAGWNVAQFSGLVEGGSGRGEWHNITTIPYNSVWAGFGFYNGND